MNILVPIRDRRLHLPAGAARAAVNGGGGGGGGLTFNGSGLQAWWTGNGTANDAHTTAKHLTLVSGLGYTAANSGPLGTGRAFNGDSGAGSYASLAADAAWVESSAKFRAFWARHNGALGADQGVFQNITGVTGQSSYFESGTDSPRFTIDNANTADPGNTMDLATDNSWQHYVFSQDAVGNIKLYKNGVWASEITIAHGAVATDPSITMEILRKFTTVSDLDLCEIVNVYGREATQDDVETLGDQTQRVSYGDVTIV